VCWDAAENYVTRTIGSQADQQIILPLALITQIHGHVVLNGMNHRTRASRDMVRWITPHSPLYIAWKEGTRLQEMAIKQTTPTAAAYVHITQSV